MSFLKRTRREFVIEGIQGCRHHPHKNLTGGGLRPRRIFEKKLIGAAILMNANRFHANLRIDSAM